MFKDDWPLPELDPLTEEGFREWCEWWQNFARNHAEKLACQVERIILGTKPASVGFSGMTPLLLDEPISLESLSCPMLPPRLLNVPSTAPRRVPNGKPYRPRSNPFGAT